MSVGQAIPTTPHYNFNQPPHGYQPWDTLINANFGALDTLLFNGLVNQYATDPSPCTGKVWYNTAEAQYKYCVNGSGAVFGVVANGATFDNSGAGVASGAKFDGSSAYTISYNTIGAAPIASPIFTGTVTFPVTGSTQCLHVNSLGQLSGVGQDCGGGAGNPGGASNSIQFNNNSFFGGITLSAGQLPVGTSGSPVAQSKTVIDVRDYGVKCDGSTNDTTAMNNAFAAAVAVGTSTGTAHVKIPAGVCKGNFTIVQGKGLKIEGSGELSTELLSPNSSPALQINGLWYSSFSDMQFAITNHNTTGAVLEIDGNYDGTHTQGVQFLTFTNVLVSGIGVSDGQMSLYAVAVCRQSSGACQGSNLTFVNDAFSWASSAVYVQNGFNALSNQFIGGDFQQYTTNGIYNNGGGIQVLGTTFETAKGCVQVLNNGYDINTVGGNLQSNLIYGVRSEGWQMVSGTASAPVSIDGLTQNSAWTTYAGNTSFALNTAIKETGTDAKSHLYCATVGGTSAASPPTWPATGSVTDGTITWTEENYNAVAINNGAPNGFFNQADSAIDSSAKVAVNTWYFPLGSVSAANYDLAVSNATYAERIISLGGAFADVYSNPNSTATSTFSGISLPGTSAGILTKTGNLYLGTGLFQSHSDGIYHLSSQLQSTVATGSAPFTVASTTNVANLNASSLNGATFASPGAIGGTTPGSIAATTISASGQISSTLASGTAPFSITSTTPVANLTAVPMTYNSSGTQLTGAHLVSDRCTLGSTCSITLSGSAVYSSVTSYNCMALDSTGINPVQFTPSSGSAFTLTGTGTDTVSYMCVGN